MPVRECKTHRRWEGGRGEPNRKEDITVNPDSSIEGGRKGASERVCALTSGSDENKSE